MICRFLKGPVFPFHPSICYNRGRTIVRRVGDADLA
jgi:hypothetical protein